MDLSRLSTHLLRGSAAALAVICIATPATAGKRRWKSRLAVEQTASVTVAGTSYGSSTKLRAAWKAPKGTVDHYEVTMEEASGGTNTLSTSATELTITDLKSDTGYNFTLRACRDAECTRTLNARETVEARTPAEYWQVQGTGGSFATATRIVADGNVGASPISFGPWAGDELSGRTQLYYHPLNPEEKAPKVAIASGNDNVAELSSFTAIEGSGLRSPCRPSRPGEPPPCEGANTLVGDVAMVHAVPLSEQMGGRIRLFFEGKGTDERTRVMWIDSDDGYLGRDFMKGDGTLCRETTHYATGGPCEPTVAVGVYTDGNPNIRDARQFRVGYPRRDDERWNGEPGTFMFFTCDTDCSPYFFNQGYAVWDGVAWNVQYDDTGCPQLFQGVEVPMPVHLGGVRYKFYYARATVITGGPAPGPKPIQVLYGDGATSGDPSRLDFEDWEALDGARDVHFLWPNGVKLTADEEANFGDFVMFMPTGDPSLQVMYMNMFQQDQPNAPAHVSIGMAVLVNP
jgi:hypothetical protein